MDKSELYANIGTNMKELAEIESEISVTIFTMYQRKAQELKEKKLFEINEYFSGLAKSYGQRPEHYSDKIGRITRKYVEQLERLIRVYDDLFIEVFRTLQSTIDNQNIAIANIITINNKSNGTGEMPVDSKYKMAACAGRKIDYELIVNECYARIKWCIENIQKDADEVFVIKFDQMDVYKEGFWGLIKKLFARKIYGKSKLQDFLETYENTHMNNIRTKNNTKILKVAATIKGFNKQIASAKNQINEKYQINV